MSSMFSRREAVALGLGGLGTAAFVPGAWAVTEASAKALIERMVVEIYRVIDSGISEKAMYPKFEAIFQKYADVDIIARQALGADTRRATPAQLRDFIEAFRGYISRRYGRRFREFIGGRIDVVSAEKVKSFYEVRSVAYLRDRAPLEVRFLVSDKGGREMFFNMFIEGVNMMMAERTEVGAMLDRRGGDIDKLVQDLRRAG